MKQLKMHLKIPRPAQTPKAVNRTRVTSVYMGEKEYDKIRRAAILCGLSVSSFLLSVGLSASRQLSSEVQEYADEIDRRIKEKPSG